jgi:excisionase family DNA binding protein
MEMDAPDCEDRTGGLPMSTTTAAPLMTPKAVAEYLDVPLATVHAWRVKGTGPRAHKVGKHLRYRMEDVDAWLEQRADRRGV